MKSVITIGEAMGLFVANEVGPLEEIDNYTRYTAGAEMNVAIGLSRLGFDVHYATQFGEDPVGRYVKNSMDKLNIGTDYIYFTPEYTTGLMIKEKVLTGDPKVASFRKNSAASKFSKDLLKDVDFSKFDHVHLAGIFLALSETTKEVSHYFVDMAKQHNTTITFDPNLRPGLWKSTEDMVQGINEIAVKCDTVLPGVEEGKILTGSDVPEEIANYYLEKGVKTVIVKLGPDGAYVKQQNQEGITVPGFKVEEVVDTVGAGDGFAVGVISALLEGLTVAEAAKRGNAIGALQVMSPGDNDGLPTREQLATYMNK